MPLFCDNIYVCKLGLIIPAVTGCPQKKGSLSDMNELISLGCTALPLGDDTPVMLYAMLGCGAVVLLIAATALGKLSAEQKKKKKIKSKRPSDRQR